jgi:hypothetical protein
MCAGGERTRWCSVKERFGQSPVEVLSPDRLRQIGVHTTGEAALHIALQRMSGERDNWQMASGRFLAIPNGSGGLKAIHVGHLDVHEHEIDLLPLQNRNGLAPIAGHQDRVATLLQHAQGESLVHDVVLGQQDPQFPD